MNVGDIIGRYEILSQIGSGGTGNVYRCLDTSLEREVAIKVLRPGSRDEDTVGRARLRREARVLASLTHPNIAAVYGLETEADLEYIVLELVPGQTLSTLLARKGALPIEVALRYALNIAIGLEVAHRHGVIHRDLKPGNVMVTPDDQIKILDFGLARTFRPPGGDLRDAETESVSLTSTGTLGGTAPYMSPEQARGDEADQRTDIWSFGCVLYEMLTGERTFLRRTFSDTLVAILEHEPDWEALPEVPAPVTWLLHRCLAKDTSRRLRHIGDARVELEDLLREGSNAWGPPPARSRRERTLVPWLVAGVAVAMAAWGVVGNRERPEPRRAAMTITLPSGGVLETTPHTNPGPGLAISPDASHVAFVMRDLDGQTRLYLREICCFDSRRIEGTEDAQLPFFSPDGEWVGFFSAGRLMKVAVSGGAPLPVTSVDPGWGGTWLSDGTIVFTPTNGSGLERVSEEGGTPTPLTRLGDGELEHDFPQALPDGRGVLYSIWTGAGFRLGLVDVDTRETAVLLEDAALGHRVGRHLVYGLHDRLFVRPFDWRGREFTGPARTLAAGVTTDDQGMLPHFDVSANGALIYAVGGPPTASRNLVWVDRNGSASPVTPDRRPYAEPQISPDGERIATVIDGRLFVYQMARGSYTQVTFAGRFDAPRWTPDSSWILCSGSVGGDWNLYRLPADGSAEPEPLLDPGPARWMSDVSRDGRFLLFVELSDSTRDDIWLLSLEDPERAPVPLVATTANELSAAFSPDAEWLAYAADSGRTPEIYIRRRDGTGRRWQISDGGGTEPAWSTDGSELFYRSGSRMMRVALDRDRGMMPGTATELFSGEFLETVPRNYDVAPDGRFLMVQPPEEAAGLRLELVLGWDPDSDGPLR